jgi:hypothetical protein
MPIPALWQEEGGHFWRFSILWNFSAPFWASKILYVKVTEKRSTSRSALLVATPYVRTYGAASKLSRRFRPPALGGL